MAAMEKNREFRDRTEHRKHVTFCPGDFVLVWGPTSAGAPYPDKKKLLYQWSTPRVVHERVSDLHYRLLERVEHKHSTTCELAAPDLAARRWQAVSDQPASPCARSVAPPARTPGWRYGRGSD